MAATDEESQTLTKYIWTGFPKSHHELLLVISQFLPMHEELYSTEGVVIKENKIIIPQQQGVNGTLVNVR